MWRLTVSGEPQLYRPDGTPIEGLSRKSRGLLALLAYHQGAPVPRSEAAEALWPGTSYENQLNSLRQAINEIKRIVGIDHPVSCSRLQLSLDISRCALQDFDKDDLKQFASTMREPWFRTLRDGRSNQEFIKDPAYLDWHDTKTTTAALAQLMEWTAANQPASVLSLCYEFSDLISGLEPSFCYRLVTKALELAPANHKLRGWGYLAQAIATAFLNRYGDAIKTLGKAKEIAVENRNSELLSACLVYDSGLASIQGRANHALNILAQASSQSWIVKSELARGRLEHAKGLALAHSGKFGEGVKELENSARRYQVLNHSFEHGHVLANLAWIAATTGQIAKAKETLALLKQHPSRDSWRIALTKKLATTAINIETGRLANALGDARNVTENAELMGQDAFRIYGLELCALIHWKKGEFESAKDCLSIAVAQRTTSGFALSDWDKHRLKPLLGCNSTLS